MTRGLAGNKPVFEGADSSRTTGLLSFWWLSKSVAKLPVEPA
jgi:hypothetical protein